MKLTILLLFILGGLAFLSFNLLDIQDESSLVESKVEVADTPIPTASIEQAKFTEASQSALLPSRGYVKQTFNNCGPATLSMVLTFFGKPISQQELGEAMRPYQHPTGDNDDKSIFAKEFVTHAKRYGFESLERPNGTLEKIKLLTTNGIPVIVRTWLHPNEDIGHFRVIRGFDDNRQVIIQDDSYEGPDRSIPYDEFSSMWQPFNYGYILIYPKDKEDLINAILGEDKDERTAYSNSINRAEEELQQMPQSYYSYFNLATAYYNLGEYEKSVEMYEKSKPGLPRRMLWYQLEPILALQQTEDFSQVNQIIDGIFSNNNRGFSELYQIRGEMYLAEGKKDLARAEFEKAIFYNKNFEKAKQSLENL